MRQETKDRFNDDILATACQRFRLEHSACTALDGFESFIYKYEGEPPRILRISHTNRRTIEEFEAEALWIEFLAGRGARVAKALRSDNGALTEVVDDSHGGAFLANLFTFATGAIRKRSDWNERMLGNYGRMLGQLHSLTLDYKAPQVRRHWDDPKLIEVDEFLDPDDTAVLDARHAVGDRLAALQIPSDAYGLIHNDAHAGNFHVDDDDELTLFDFDDCCYAPFIKDIAVVLWHAGSDQSLPRSDFFAWMWEHFLRGYRQKFELSRDQYELIRDFLLMRDISIYAVVRRSYVIGKQPDEIDKDIARFKEACRKRIVTKQARIELDWSSFL